MTMTIAPEWTAAEQHNSSNECRAMLGITRIVPFYYRNGYEVQDTVYAYGKKRFTIRTAYCKRCGGKGGAEAWKHTGYTCYECGGNGGAHKVHDPVYTAEQLAKLNARQEAVLAKKQAAIKAKADAALAAFTDAHADLIAKVAKIQKPSDFIAKVMEKGAKYGSLSAAQVDAVNKAADRDLERQAVNQGSQWVGAVNDKIEFTATVTFVTGFESRFGYTYVTGLRDDAGNILIQKGVSIGDKGDRLTIKATVKEHAVRDGVKQTIITRPKVK